MMNLVIHLNTLSFRFFLRSPFFTACGHPLGDRTALKSHELLRFLIDLSVVFSLNKAGPSSLSAKNMVPS